MNEGSFSIVNAHLWLGNGDGIFGDLVVRGGRIEEIGREVKLREPVIDAEGKAISPGLIDLMVLGGFGISVMKGDALEIARSYIKLGVTACQFCTGNLPWEDLEAIAANVRGAKKSAGRDEARIIGLYFEGPFMQPECSGAGLSEFALPATRENIERFVEHMSDVLTMMNISPGTEGDTEAIAALKRCGILVSMAHSDAEVEVTNRCIEAGTEVLGHVFCNNPGLIHQGVQQPTIDHVGLTDERIKFVHLICDTYHTAPVMINLVARCRGHRSIILVTDCIPQAGCPDGDFLWDDGRVFTKRDGVGRTAERMLMGSATLLPDMFRNFLRVTGLPPHEGICTVTGNPARSLGLEEDFGLLFPGRFADLVMWNASLQVERVWKAGHEIVDISNVPK